MTGYPAHLVRRLITNNRDRQNTVIIIVAYRQSPRPQDGTPDYVPLHHMTDDSFDKDNRFTVTMENGSMWRQMQENSVKARWCTAPATYTASIVPAAFGHMMRVSDGHS